MNDLARALLVAFLQVAIEATPSHARGLDLRDPASRPVAGFRALARGPTIRPGAQIIADDAGRLRTLELDDLAPLRLRLSIPF